MDNDVEDLFDQGLKKFNIDAYDEAIKIFKKVLEMNPDHPDALYYRALAWAIKGDYNRPSLILQKQWKKIRSIRTV